MRSERRKYPFWSEALEPYRHRDILVYINIEAPEVLICSDLKQKEFFQVKMQRYDAMHASPEVLSGMYQQRGKFMARSKGLSKAKSDLR